MISKSFDAKSRRHKETQRKIGKKVPLHSSATRNHSENEAHARLTAIVILKNRSRAVMGRDLVRGKI